MKTLNRVAADLPRTKLQSPILRHVIERPLLVARLATQVETHRLTLISAPAGSGKTMLLSLLVAELRTRPCAWLSLDLEDNSPVRFAWGLISTLQRLTAACGERALAMLEDGVHEHNLRLFIGALINDVIETLPDPFALILDDLHEITGELIYQALDYLIEHSPPQMRLIVAARHDPPLALAKWRARGEVSEIRYEELRFSPQEAQSLLNIELGLHLAPDLLERVFSSTEGWAAGLRLMGLSLAGKSLEQRVYSLQNLERERTPLFDLLANEVFDQQDATMQRFLLDTSVLSELTSSLCAAAAECSVSLAEERLQELQRRNLFILETDTSYRYHDLFRAFLENRLRRNSPDSLANLHRRVAAAETNDARAIQHWLAANDWESAANCIEAAGLKLYLRGADVPQSWLDGLPDQLISHSAGLSFLCGVNALFRSDFAMALPHLQRAAEYYEQAGDTLMLSETLSHLPIVISYGSTDYLERQRSASLVLARLFTLPTQAGPHTRGLLARFWMRLTPRDLAEAQTDLNDALRLTMASNSPLVARNALTSIHATSLLLCSDTSLISTFVQVMENRYGEGYGQLQVSLSILAASLSFLEGNLSLARERAIHSQQLIVQIGAVVFSKLHLNLVLLWIYWATADSASSEALPSQRLAGMTTVNVSSDDYTYLFLALCAYGRWSVGQIEGLSALARELGVLVSANPSAELTFCAELTAALAELASGDESAASSRLPLLVAFYDRQPSLVILPNPRWLLSYTLLKLRQPEEAVDVIEPVLTLAQQRNWHGMILREGRFVRPLLELAIERKRSAEFARHTLRLFEVILPSAVPIPGTDETISPREMDVLRQVASGASNQQIADTLVLSIWTVKSHLTSILGKLGVTSRTQAVMKAQALGLL